MKLESTPRWLSSLLDIGRPVSRSHPIAALTCAWGLAALALACIALPSQAAPDTQPLTTAGNVAPTAVLQLVPNSGTYEAGMIQLVTDSAAVMTNIDLPRPDYFVPFTDPTFGTRVMRYTEDAPTPFTTPFGSGVWGTDARHHYMTDQPWNVDGTLLAIENEDTPRQMFLDGETYEIALLECGNYDRRDDRWHPTMPDVRINVKNDQLSWFDVVNCVLLRGWTLPFVVKGIGDGAGNPSADGRYVALADSTRMFVVDMDPQPPYAPYPNVRIGPVYDFSTCSAPNCRLGWVSMSPSGTYVVLKHSGDYPRVFDLDPVTLAVTPRVLPEASTRCTGTGAAGYLYDIGHGDLAVNPFDANEDVLIGQEHCGYRGQVVDGKLMGGVVMVRLSDGLVTPLTDPTNEAYPHHVSTRNVDRPGWAFAGYYSDPGRRFSNELVAVKMDGSLSVERLAHLHSQTPACYRCEAHAVPSRDGRRAVWASNWSIHCTTCGPPSEIKGYIVDTRPPIAAAGPHTEPLTVTADASGSFDLDGTIVSYTFDFDDGTVIGPQPVPYATHALIAGTRDVTVTVIDDLGESHSTSQPITVQGSDLPPQVVVAPAASINVGGTLNLAVTVLEPNSDPITSLTADLSALPGSHGAVFSPGPGNETGTLTWTPTAQGGPFAVTFTATNALVGIGGSNITVTASNQSPSAVLTVTPEDGVGPLTVTADGSGSSDIDGTVATYTFDFGDGTIIGPQASPSAQHTYLTGPQLITLTVADNLSALGVDSAPVNIFSNLALNPSFEGSTFGWKENGDAVFMLVTGGVDGMSALKMTGPAVVQSYGVNDSPNWIDPVAGAGKTYRFSAWVRSTTSTGDAEIKIREYLNGVKQGSTFRSDPVVLSPTWQQISTDYVTRVSGSELDVTVSDDPILPNQQFEVDMVQIGLIDPTLLDVADPPTSSRPLTAWVTPNPVRQQGTLHLTTTRPGPLSVSVYDTQGRRVADLLDNPSAPAGQHVVSFIPRKRGGAPLEPGVYFYRVRAAEGTTNGRFMILR